MSETGSWLVATRNKRHHFMEQRVVGGGLWPTNGEWRSGEDLGKQRDLVNVKSSPI